MDDKEIETPLPEQNTQPKVLVIFANIISYVFHPVFMPAIITYILYKLSPQSFAGTNMFDLSVKPSPLVPAIILSTVFFPLFTILLIKGLGFIESIKMHNAKDRIMPLMATMIFYFWAYSVLDNTNAPLLLRVLMLGSFWGIIGIFMINIFYKISMHTTGAGAVIGIFIVLMILSSVNMILPLFIALFIAGLVGSTRMILKAHQQGEIWMGYVLGILVQLGAYWYLT